MNIEKSQEVLRIFGLFQSQNISVLGLNQPKPGGIYNELLNICIGYLFSTIL